MGDGWSQAISQQYLITTIGWNVFCTCIQQYRCHKLSLQRIELAITSVSSLLANQLTAPESQRARDHGQSAVVTPQVKRSFAFLSRFSRHLIDFIPIYIHIQLAVQAVTVVSAMYIVVFRLVDNLLSSSLQIVHWPNYKLNSLANSNHDTGTSYIWIWQLTCFAIRIRRIR